MVHSGKGLISVFQEFSASIGGAGRWAFILWGLESFLIFSWPFSFPEFRPFPNFIGF